jgi:hypothetical protein
VLCTLAGAPFSPQPVFRVPEGQFVRQLDRLHDREAERFGSDSGVMVGLAEVRKCVASPGPYVECVPLPQVCA